jgi:hypothetical protein
MKSYQAEKMNSDANPLEWWNENRTKFLKIAYVARQVLAVPATSVPSERIFSTADILINKPRNRLSGVSRRDHLPEQESRHATRARLNICKLM